MISNKNNSNGHYRPLFRNCWVDRRRSTILEQSACSCSGEFDLFPQYYEENKTVNAKLIYHPDTLEIIGGQLISKEFLLSDLNLLADIVKQKHDSTVSS